MKLLFLIIILSFANVQAQGDMTEREKIIKEFIQNRKAMMDKMLDAFGEDDFLEDDMDDAFFSSIIGTRFDKFKNNKMVSVERLQKENGDIDIFIKPRDKTVKLDIETKNSSIIIKANKIEKIESTSTRGQSSRSNNQSMMQTVSIPAGYKALAPKEVDEKILITLTKTIIQNTDKVPLPKRKGEGTI